MPSKNETGSVQAAVWTTEYVDSLPSSSFAYVDKDGGKHLPYKDKDGKVDLPHARNALARLNQVKGMSEEEKNKIRAKLQSALKNAKAADDVILRTTNAIQASDVSGLPDRVHLLRDGDFNTQKYGTIPLKAADLYEMKINFDRGVGMAHEGETGIPIDFAHQSHLKAAGWIRGLDVVQADGGTELWGSNVEWSDSGKTALLGKEYKCLSSDFYPAAFGEWVDAESGISAKNVIVGAALTNRPMFTGNQPVIASEAEAEAAQEAEASGVKTVVYVNANEIKETSMNLDQLRVKAAEDVTGAEQRFLQAHAADLSTDERKKFEIAEPVAAAANEEDKPKVVNASEVTGAEGVVSIQATDLKAIQDSIAALKASNEALQASTQASEEEKVKSEVIEHAKRGAIKADAIDNWTKMIVSASGETREMLINNLKSLADNPLIGKTFGSSSTEGSAEMDIEAEILKKVREVMASDKIDAIAARKKVLASDPDLEARAAQAVRASTSEFNPLEQAWGTNARGLQGVNADIVK